VSALELELQAEVDKYVTCLLAGDPGRRPAPPGAAGSTSSAATSPTSTPTSAIATGSPTTTPVATPASLERRFVPAAAIVDMFAELRRFYRLPLAGKLDAIARAA
jgi:hypothetical protein